MPIGMKPPAERQKDNRREYEKHRARDPKLALSKRLRNSGVYIAFRRRFRAKYPLCIDPESRHPGRLKPTAQLHHIESLELRPDLLTSTRDCAGLCTGCHAAISQAERRGIDTRHLFAAWRAKIDAEPLPRVY